MTIKTKFDLEQDVSIKSTGQVASVAAILVNKNTEYQVVFWEKGTRRLEWVREFELDKPKESPPECGFKPPQNQGV